MPALISPHDLWFARFRHQDGTQIHAIILSDTEEQARAALIAYYGQLIFSISELIPLTLGRLQDLFALDPACPLVLTLTY